MKSPQKIVLTDKRPAGINFTLPSGKTIKLVHKPHDIVLNKKPPALPFQPKTRSERYT